MTTIIIKMSFYVKEERSSEPSYCRLHNERVIQLGSCLTCETISSICEFKGCIKHHEENEKIHNVVTIEYVRNIVHQYLRKDMDKRAQLKKLVSDYFMTAKKELESLFDNIYNSISQFKFENIILNDDQLEIAQRLIQEKYNETTCSQIAIILPKLKKCAHFQDGHFTHLQDFIAAEKFNIEKIFNSTLLNLPYFREYQRRKLGKNQEKFTCQISSQLLSDVNAQLRKVRVNPKKLRLRYIDDQGDQNQRRQFIRQLVVNEQLTSINKIELFCLWNIQDEDFQVAFFEAISKMPYLKEVKVITGYKVTDPKFIYDVVREDIDVKIYKEDWQF